MGVVDTLLVLRRIAVKKQDQDICARGLEHVINDSLCDDRERRKSELIRAVLMEQEDQRQRRRMREQAGEEGEKDDDEEALADTSRVLSKKSMEMAGLMGRNDAAAVRVLLRPVRRFGACSQHQQRSRLTLAAA